MNGIAVTPSSRQWIKIDTKSFFKVDLDYGVREPDEGLICMNQDFQGGKGF